MPSGSGSTTLRDGIAASAMLLVAVWVIRDSAKLPFGAVRNPGPGFVPWWTGVTLAGLSLILFAQVLRARRAAAPRPRAEPDRGWWLRVGGLVLALALYVLLLDLAGYPLCTFLLALFMLRPTGRQSLIAALALAVLASGGSYLVFAVWLGVPLPPGPFAR